MAEQIKTRGPAGPSLSEVLGSANSAPEATAARKGGSTFDTLNGNVLVAMSDRRGRARVPARDCDRQLGRLPSGAPTSMVTRPLICGSPGSIVRSAPGCC